MVEAIKIWNEPNNKSHWDLDLDPDWHLFSDLVKCTAASIRTINPDLTLVLGGISPIDPVFIHNLSYQGVIDAVDVVALHGFPLDWNHWPIDAWPQKLDEIRAITAKPLWVTEVGVSSFGAQEVQEFGVRRTAELLKGQVDRIYWYSLFDLPKAWPATTRHREAEGSSYYRHFYMGLIDEEGNPKLALDEFAKHTPELGICQWFHFEDPRLDSAVEWMKKLGVKHVRTGLSWADVYQPNAVEWFDRQMKALEDFEVTITFCFTPCDKGITDHYCAPPKDVQEFADFCAWMVSRYAPAKVETRDLVH